MTYPATITLYPERVDRNASGWYISGEYFNVPSSSPYQMYLDHVPMNAVTTQVYASGGAEWTEDLTGTPAAGEFYVEYDVGRVTFNVANVDAALEAKYSTLGDDIMAEHVNNMQNEVYAIEGELGQSTKGSFSTLSARLDSFAVAGANVAASTVTISSPQGLSAVNVQEFIDSSGTVSRSDTNPLGLGWQDIYGVAGDMVRAQNNITTGYLYAKTLTASGVQFGINSDGPDQDQWIYFYDGSASDGQWIKWADASDRFELSAETYMHGDVTASGSMYMFEQAAAVGDTPAYGQLWVKDDAPNTIWFTNDDGTDVQLGAGGGTPTVITVADESSDTTCFPLFATAATGDLGPRTGTNLTFNSNTGELAATTITGANVTSGSDPGHTHTGGSVPTQITVADESSDTSCYIAYFISPTGDLFPKTGTNLTFNSSTGVLTATGFAGPITGAVTGNCSGQSGTVATIAGLAPDTATTQASQGNITSLGTLSALTMGGDINLDGNNIDNGGVVFLKEQASADGDVGGSGQIWVKTGAPNTLWFTDEDGTDAQLGVGGTPVDITVADESSDTSCYVCFFTADTGDLGPKTGTNLTFNSSTGILTATGFAGDITGNVTGNTSGSSGSCTGNSATATLASTVTVDATTSDTTCFVGIFESDSGSLEPQTDATLTYNANTGALSSTTFVGNITGDVTGACSTITVADESSDTSCYVAFFTGPTGDLPVKSGSNLTFNSSTGELTASTFSGDITGNVTGNCSGTAATVTGAAQTNITSLGTLTALTIDNITIDGNTITADTGALNLTPAGGSAIVLDGTINIDAGVVTGATSITSTAFVGDITGNVTLPDAGEIVLDVAPASDLTGTGFSATMTVDVNASGVGAALHLDTDGNWIEADANSTVTMPCTALALESGTGSKKVLFQGAIRDDRWNWTPGGIVYVDNTAASFSQASPSGVGDQIQVAGIAFTADVLYFNPSPVLVEFTS